MPVGLSRSVPVAEVIKHPKHPYATGLMGAIPALGAKVNRLTQISGAMPRLNAIPKGLRLPATMRVGDCQMRRIRTAAGIGWRDIGTLLAA